MVFGNCRSSLIEVIKLWCVFHTCKVFGFRGINDHVNLMVEQYELGTDQDGKFIRFAVRVCYNIQGGLQQRKVYVKSIKQYAQPRNARCVLNLFKEDIICTYP